MTVLRRDKLRAQRQHLAVADANQCGAQHDMVIFALARASKSGATLRTLNLVRVVEFRPIQCQKATPVENLERLKGLILLHLIKRYVESGVNVLTIDAIQLFSNMIVRWQFADAEQRPTRIFAVRLMESSLMLKKRRRLHEKSRKRCHRDIDEGVLFVAAVARVCDGVESFSQFSNEMIDHQFHAGVS